MATEIIESLVEGGKASAGPPLGPALGPKGVNIGKVIQDINKATEAFKGMQVPVKVIINTDTKAFTIEVGTPPASGLIKKEAGIEKGASNPKMDKVADILIEQVIKVAKMKESALLGKNLKQRVKEVICTCQSMGILVEGVPAHEAIELVNEGKFDAEIKAEKTELSADEKKHLEEEKKKLAADIEKRRSEFESRAKAIMEELKDKGVGAIRSKMREVKIPQKIIDELAPLEKVAEPGAAPVAAAAKKA
jgi:large subunit ribosomal protein L11